MTRNAKQSLFLVVCAMALGAAYQVGWRASDSTEVYVSRPVGTLTFTKDIARIIFENCSTCHRPDQSAPLTLLSYSDVRNRAEQIADVTETGFMPPWLPEKGNFPFADERLLDADQIGMIRQWASEGAVEGDSDDLPEIPDWTEGWQLGEPDMIIRMPESYMLPAEGNDTFRNFVIPIPVDRMRYVRAVELRPGNPKIVHHAVMMVDASPSSRILDKESQEVGFDGMKQGSGATSPDGHFLAWTPGKVPYSGSDEMVWRLRKGTDMILQLHMLPSGKPEPIQSSIGFFFSESPPKKFPAILRLGSQTIDIPAGEENYVIEDSFPLPVDVEVLSIYPHAHYLGRDMQCGVLLPDQTEYQLLKIEDWDFNWQDEYRYLEPVFLPKGTILSMRYTYDNSAENVRNPNAPPRHIVFGPESSDEMGDLWIQLLPRLPENLAVLQAKCFDKDMAECAAGLKLALERKPDDIGAHFNYGVALGKQGNLGGAIVQYKETLKIKPSHVEAQINLGESLYRIGQLNEAEKHLKAGLALDPDREFGHLNLGVVYENGGKITEAEAAYRKALRLNSDSVFARYNLGNALMKQGKLNEAKAQYEHALRLQPDFEIAHFSIGIIHEREGNFTEAAACYERALTINPNYQEARDYLRGIQAVLRKAGR